MDSAVDRLLVELGLLSPPLTREVVGADVYLCRLAGDGSSLDVADVGVLVTESLKEQWLKAVSSELVHDDLPLTLVVIPEVAAVAVKVVGIFRMGTMGLSCACRSVVQDHSDVVS